MQIYKKQGLDEAESEFICSERKIFVRGIPKMLVLKSKIQTDHLSCFICNQIIWKAVSCGQQNCFANFCEYCVSNYSQQMSSHQSELGSIQTRSPELKRKCPKCERQFQRTNIPLINSLLSEITFKCPHWGSGCEDIISYDGYLKHALQCNFRKISCEGCSKYFLQKDIHQHKKVCSFIVVKCEKCFLKLPQSDFNSQHSEIKCLELQLHQKTENLKNLELTVEQLKSRLNSYETVMEKIIKGETIPLHMEFYSSFPFNFQFANSEAKLCKSSWNAAKQKFDFLHFYVTSSIKTQSPVGFQWKIQVKMLKGNLLIGICSSLSTNSVDFVINRFGEIKKKQSNQNKYKLIRKGNLTFSEGDTISFKYLALRKILKIENEMKKVEARLETKQISELGENLYSFYSLDTINDCIKFI